MERITNEGVDCFVFVCVEVITKRYTLPTKHQPERDRTTASPICFNERSTDDFCFLRSFVLLLLLNDVQKNFPSMDLFLTLEGAIIVAIKIPKKIHIQTKQQQHLRRNEENSNTLPEWVWY